MEAYESFENYLNKLYANIGYIDNTFWPMRDYGNISISELKDKDINYFIEQTIKKKGRPETILCQLRKKIASIKIYEERNTLNINFHFMINIISKIRHVIVHNNGFVKDRKLFIENILKSSGLYNNGKYDIENYQYVKMFFGENKYENMIALVEILDQENSSPSVKVHFDRFNELISNLSSYVLLLNILVKGSLSQRKLIKIDI